MHWGCARRDQAFWACRKGLQFWGVRIGTTHWGCARRDRSFGVCRKRPCIWGKQGQMCNQVMQEGTQRLPSGEAGASCPPVSVEEVCGGGDALRLLCAADGAALLQGQHQCLCSGAQLLHPGDTHMAASLAGCPVPARFPTARPQHAGEVSYRARVRSSSSRILSGSGGCRGAAAPTQPVWASCRG